MLRVVVAALALLSAPAPLLLRGVLGRDDGAPDADVEKSD